MINIHGVHNVRQKDIQTAEPLVPEPSLVEVKIAIVKLKRYNPQVLIRFRPNWSELGVKIYVLRYTNLFVLYGIRRNCHSSGRNLLLYQFIKRAIRLTVIITEGSPSCELPTKPFQHFLARLTPYVNEVNGDHQCGFRRNSSTTEQIFYVRQVIEKIGSIMGRCMNYLWTWRKPMTQLRERFFTTFSLNLVFLRS
jgi:hypothetical protein